MYKEITLKKIVVIIIVYTAIVSGLTYSLTPKPTINENDKDKESYVFDITSKSKEILSSMYDNNGVKELISRNESLRKNFTPEAMKYVDLTDKEVYLQRYTEFHNRNTSLTVNDLQSDLENNSVSVFYIVSNGVDIPSMRSCIIKFDNTGLVKEFKEYHIDREIINLSDRKSTAAQ